MKETNGVDIFEQLPHASALCLPTNCSIIKDNRSNELINPMGALAGAFAKRWGDLPIVYADLLTITPRIPIILGWVDRVNTEDFYTSIQLDLEEIKDYCAIVAYPTMYEIGKPASLDLVVRSGQLLVELADLNKWNEVYCGSPGTGIGGLQVDTVHGELKKILDDRFTIMQK